MQVERIRAGLGGLPHRQDRVTETLRASRDFTHENVQYIMETILHDLFLPRPARSCELVAHACARTSPTRARAFRGVESGNTWFFAPESCY